MAQPPKPRVNLPTEPAAGISYRFVKLKYAHDPISGIGAFKAGGRYHIKGGFRALYTSETPVGALAETEFLVRSEENVLFKPAPPMVLFALEYRLDRVLDLRDPITLAQLGVERAQLFTPWIRGTPESPRPTQKLAKTAYEAGVQGLLAPTAVPPHEATNVIIYPDHLEGETSWVKVRDPDGNYMYRIP